MAEKFRFPRGAEVLIGLTVTGYILGKLYIPSVITDFFEGIYIKTEAKIENVFPLDEGLVRIPIEGTVYQILTSQNAYPRPGGFLERAIEGYSGRTIKVVFDNDSNKIRILGLRGDSLVSALSAIDTEPEKPDRKLTPREIADAELKFGN